MRTPCKNTFADDSFIWPITLYLCHIVACFRIAFKNTRLSALRTMWKNSLPRSPFQENAEGCYGFDILSKLLNGFEHEAEIISIFKLLSLHAFRHVG